MIDLFITILSLKFKCHWIMYNLTTLYRFKTSQISICFIIKERLNVVVQLPSWNERSTLKIGILWFPVKFWTKYFLVDFVKCKVINNFWIFNRLKICQHSKCEMKCWPEVIPRKRENTFIKDLEANKTNSRNRETDGLNFKVKQGKGF